MLNYKKKLEYLASWILNSPLAICKFYIPLFSYFCNSSLVLDTSFTFSPIKLQPFSRSYLSPIETHSPKWFHIHTLGENNLHFRGFVDFVLTLEVERECFVLFEFELGLNVGWRRPLFVVTTSFAAHIRRVI